MVFMFVMVKFKFEFVYNAPQCRKTVPDELRYRFYVCSAF